MKKNKIFAGLFLVLIVWVLGMPVQASVPARPEAPILKGVAQKGEVTLTWNPVKNAKGYSVYLYYKKENSFKCVADIDATEECKLTLKGSLDRVYRYRIRAYNKQGNKNIYSNMSKELLVKTAPRRAKITSAVIYNARTTLIKWNKIPSAEGYQVIRSENKKGPYKRIAVISGNRTFSFEDTKADGKKLYYRVRAYRRNDGKAVYGAYSLPKQPKKQAGTRPLMVIGDSRTVMMKEIFENASKDIAWICKISMGYTWLKNTAVAEADRKLKANSDIVIWLGVNDVYNISNYITWLNKQIPKWKEKGARVYVMAVGQVDYDPYVNNKEIRSFNSRMKSGIKGAGYIDLYEYLEDAGYRTTDGIHYDNATSKKIYDYMIKSIR